MVNSAQVVLIFSLLAVVLIPLLHIGVEGHWEHGANHDDGDHDEMEPHSHDDHGHHHHGRKLAVCEKQNGNCEHEHGEEDEEQEVAEFHQHGSSSHAHAHGDHDHHGESQAHSHSHFQDQDDHAHDDSHAHSVDQHDHGEHEAHSHSEHSHHSCAHSHAHAHDDDRGEHLLEEKNQLGKAGHFHSHGEDGHHFGHHHHDDDPAQTKSLTMGLWLRAMGCSLLVSLASLVCLLFLPLIVTGGKPSRRVVDALAGFGAGCMLGDALLHQLPHAFSGGHGEGGHSHAQDHHHSHEHEPTAGGEHAHGHSLQDLSVGLAVLAGILLFFLVEKIVRRTEELSVEGHALGHSHHHHHHHRGKKDDDEITKDDISAEETEKQTDSNSGLRKRKTRAVEESEKVDPSAVVKSEAEEGGRNGVKQQGNTSNFVLSYLNLFSDGVHNFTDGMALGSAFLLHGTVGGWSRTLFLLAHELPQEVGDFGILLRSGFGVFEALAFNFLSALMALAGTALALLLGGNPGHSSLIEGFTAGGFIYISVGAVMPDMHSQGSNLRTTASQLASLSLGMGAAILISLAE